MFPYNINDDGVFHADDIEFHIDMSPKNRRCSQSGSFTIVKNRPYLNIYGALASTIRPRTMLELGIYQGGSYVLLDKLFKPERMAALDISPPVEPLVEYCAARKERFAHFKTSQADAAALTAIVDGDLGGSLDLVVDDASHSYELTRRSFELLFPRLAPGGCYIIEDWAWSHMPGYQPQGAPWYDKPALTNLIFELIALQASSPHIVEVRVLTPLVLIRKASNETVVPTDFMASLKLRGRTLSPVI